MSHTCMSHIERYWQALTIANNELFNKGDFETALSGYKNALYRAEALNNHITDCIRLKIPFIQVYIISCNNLVNTYEELGNRRSRKYAQTYRVLPPISTDWCQYCKVQKKQLQKNKDFIDKANTFYFVEFDAESKDSIIFNGQTYHNTTKRNRNSTYQPAFALNGSNKTAFPT